MLYCECKECFGTDDVMFCENKLVQAQIAALKPKTILEDSEPTKQVKKSILFYIFIVCLLALFFVGLTFH